MRLNKVTILGIKVSNCTRSELNEYIKEVIFQDRKEMILNVNIHCMNLAHRYSWLKDLLNSAAVVFCDGDGVRLAGRWLGSKIPEKITYSRWIWELARLSERFGFTWYILGATHDSLRDALCVLQAEYPGLKIIGYHSGYFRDGAEVEEVAADINTKRPNILVLAMGMPVQEQWLRQYFDRLQVNVALTGGAVIDYVSGHFRMTPNFFYRLKMEWFYRLLQQPRRLFWRYFLGNPAFFFRVIRCWLSNSGRIREKRQSSAL